MAHRLAREGSIHRIRRGTYRCSPLEAETALPDGEYLSFRSAAAVHGLLPPEPDLQIGSERRRRPGVVAGRKARFVGASSAGRVGVEELEVAGGWLRRTTLERTIVDSVERPELVGGLGALVRLVEAGLPRAEPESLVALLRLRPRATAQRLGFLAELAGGGEGRIAELLAALDDLVRGAVRVPLGPRRRHGTRGPVHPRWRVIDNVPRLEILAAAATFASAAEPPTEELRELDVFLL